MAMQEAQAEPSMEEILASIRRIISEEDQPATEVLDLTQPAEADAEDDILAFEEPAPAPVAARAPAPPAQPAPPPVEVAPPRAPEPPPARMAAAPSPVPDFDEETLVSETAAVVAVDAFTRLAGTVRVADSAGQTLEGMIRQMVKPMLKEWLDANLPAIVEAKVEAELDRISRLAR